MLKILSKTVISYKEKLRAINQIYDPKPFIVQATGIGTGIV